MTDWPQAGVEAVARAIQREHDPEAWDRCEPPASYEMDEARAALEAAAPHIAVAGATIVNIVIQVADGGAVSETEWNALGGRLQEFRADIASCAVAEAVAAEREQIMPLLLACHKLYDTYWHKVGTVEIDNPGLNGISYDDTSALDDAAEAIELLLADGDFADLIRNPEGDTHAQD